MEGSIGGMEAGSSEQENEHQEEAGSGSGGVGVRGDALEKRVRDERSYHHGACAACPTQPGGCGRGRKRSVLSES